MAKEVQKEVKQRASKHWVKLELENALRLRLDPDVEFPTEGVIRSLENVVRRNRCVGASSPVDVGQVRLVLGYRLFVLVVEDVTGDGRSWLCMPIHHYERLKGPGDVELAKGCYVEGWQRIILQTRVLVPYGMRVPVVPKRKVEEVKAVVPSDRMLKVLKKGAGALAIFRAAEVQYVSSSVFSLSSQDHSLKCGDAP